MKSITENLSQRFQIGADPSMEEHALYLPGKKPVTFINDKGKDIPEKPQECCSRSMMKERDWNKEKHPQTYHHESHTCKRWNSWKTSYAKEETITYIAADITRRSSKNIRRSAEDSSNGYRRTHTESSKNFRRIAALTSTLM